MADWLSEYFGNKKILENTLDVSATVADGSITNAKQANMAANTVKANNTAGAAAPSDVALTASTFLARGSTGNIVACTFGTGITFTGAVASPSLYWDEATDQIKKEDGTVISDPLSAATIAALPTAAAGNDGLAYFVDNPGNNTTGIPCLVRSDGTRWDVVGGDAELISEVINTAVVSPAATFTGVTASTAAAGADTLLTSAGVHGLTSAAQVGQYIYISAGTGWTVGLHKITAIAVDTTGTTIQIDTPFSSQGAPTIALAGTELNILEFNLPPMTSRGKCTFDISADYNGVTTNSKRMKVYHAAAASAITAGTTLYNRNEATASPTARFIGGFANFGATNVQEGYTDDGQASGIGTVAAGVQITGAIQTNVATVMRVNAVLAVAGDSIKLIRISARFAI